MNRRAFALLIALASTMTRGDDFPHVIDTETARVPTMPAEQAAGGFRMPEGYGVTVFAAEPDVRNPIAMAWDGRGRLWVAENYTYAEPSARFDLRFRDRVVIFEDADGDGRHDRRTVFTDQVQMLTSVEVGRGGVWLLCPPRLLFVPDRNGDDRPDAEPEVDPRWFHRPRSRTITTSPMALRWGPDGWLYGRCGASAPGNVGVPGTPEADRDPAPPAVSGDSIPASKRFEALVHGTTNPWGHDWDALGEAFFINTVNGHLWHVAPGSHLLRLARRSTPILGFTSRSTSTPTTYHWDTAKNWTDSRKPSAEHDRRGGGHAHSGMMIYGGGLWPAEPIVASSLP